MDICLYRYVIRSIKSLPIKVRTNDSHINTVTQLIEEASDFKVTGFEVKTDHIEKGKDRGENIQS